MFTTILFKKFTMFLNYYLIMNKKNTGAACHQTPAFSLKQLWLNQIIAWQR